MCSTASTAGGWTGPAAASDASVPVGAYGLTMTVRETANMPTPLPDLQTVADAMEAGFNELGDRKSSPTDTDYLDLAERVPLLSATP